MANWIGTNSHFTWKATLLAAMILVFAVSSLYSQSDTLSGRVVAADGTPMADVAVRAMPNGPGSSGLPAILTQTDSLGQYHFEGLASGDYMLHAELEGGSGATLLGNIDSVFRVLRDETTCDPATGKCNQTTRKPIPLLMGPARVTVPDKAITEFNIVVVPAAFKVSGHLAVPSGMKLPKLRAKLTGSVSPVATETDVHSDGTFEISSVPPGPYVLRIIPNLGISPQTITVTDHNQGGIELVGKGSGFRVSGNVERAYKSPFQEMLPQWVYLVGREATDVNPITTGLQTLFMGGWVFLSVSEPASLQPGSAAPTVFVVESGAVIEEPVAPVGPDGRFEFLAVPSGAYHLRTVPEMGIPISPVTVGDADVKDVRAGSGVRVRGEIVSLNLGTRPPELISLMSVGFTEQSVSAGVHNDGSFEFPKVGPGTYRILLDNKIQPTPAEVTIGDEDLIFRWEAPFKAWITGRVLFTKSSSMPDDLAALHLGQRNGSETAINADGSFRLQSDEGKFEVLIENLPEECVVKSVAYGTENLLEEPGKVDLTVPTREMVVTLECKTAVVQ